MHETPKTVPDSPPADLTAEAGPSAADETANSFPRTSSETNPAFGPPCRPDEIGSLGPYRVIKELGRGGMGAVYLGFDERLKRRVALKVMLPQYAASATSKNRFLREARAAAGIAHDHIVTIHEADERDGTPYMAMQLLQGHPLDEYIKLKGRLDLAEVLRIGRETALGLAAAHGVGLVHRDIKPANLWMEAPTGRIKILDFGLAKPTQEEQQDTDLTATGAILGTPAYMAPEQALGEKADSRADLFSLGVVLYRLATGHGPFHGATVMAMLASVVAEEPTPVRDRNPAVPEPLAKLIHQLLAKKPNGRPKSAAAVAEAIRQIELGTIAALPIPLQPIPLDSLPTVSNIVPGADPFAAIDATEPDDVVQRSGVPRAKRGPMPKWPFVAIAAMVAALAVVVPQIIKIATPKGTLVIETGDPDVEVVVKKGTATIYDKTKQREIVLSVGDDYQIELVEPKDGLKLSTGKFEITKNGKTTVKVRVEKPALAAKPKAAVEATNATDAGPYLEIHGATSAALADWVAKLPQGYCPDWIATRAGGTEVVFDAIANAVPGAKVPKLVTWSAKDRAEYDELKKSHRLVADAPYLLNDLYHSANVGIQDGREWETWYGSSDFVSTKIEDGLKFDRVHEGVKERWLPNSLSAIRQADGSITYSMVATWLPDRALEWRAALTEKELAATVAEYRKKGWRPHIVNPIYGNPEPTFLVVFLDNKANEAWDFTLDLTVADYEKELVARKAKGQRPRCVCSHVVGNKIGYMAVWDSNPANEKPK